MRRAVLFIGIVLLLASAFAIIDNMGLAADTSDAVDGVFDLQAPGGSCKPSQLDGQWLFAFGRTDDPATPMSQLHYDLIEVPSSWTAFDDSDGKLPSSGIATYRLQVTLPKAGTYALLLDNIYTAYRLYVDGTLLLETGRVAAMQADSQPRFTDSIVTFYSESRTVDLMLHVSNYYHPRGGIGVPPVIGAPQDIVRMLSSTHTISMLLVAVFFVAAFFILNFHHSLNKDASIIWFALLCVALGIRVMASNSLLVLLFPAIPTWVVSKIEYATVAVAIVGMMTYSRHAFPTILPRAVEDIISGVSAAYFITVLFAPITVYNPLYLPYSLFFGLGLLYWVISMTVSFAKQRAVPATVVMGSWVCVGMVLVQLAYWILEIPNVFVNHIAAIGIAFFIIVHFHEFSLKFVQALALSRRTSLELEKEVSLRTIELHRLNERLALSASRDALTGLYNHNELYKRTVEDTRSYNTTTDLSTIRFFAVAYLDLDNFKYFNDAFNHKVGDLVLSEFARHMAAVLPETVTSFRAGGDEFILFMPDYDYGQLEYGAKLVLDSLADLSGKLEEAIERQTGLKTSIPAERQLTCSIGIAIHEMGLLDIERLIQLADAALHEAKMTGKARFCIEIEPHPVPGNA
jgi:diguanylate cyclase (GGDEF)-like protein